MVSPRFPFQALAFGVFLSASAMSLANPYLPGAGPNTPKPKPLGQMVVPPPPAYDPNFLAAVSLYKAGKLSDSIAKLNLAIAKDPKNSAALGLAGFLLIHTNGDQALAEKYLRAALKIDPHNATDCANLGSILARESHYAAAVPFLKIASDANPKDVMSMARLGICYAQTGDMKNALAVYQKCSTSPSCPMPILMNYALMLAKSNQYLPAARVYEHIGKIDPTNATAWSSAGMLYAMTHDNNGTVRCLSQAIKLGPTDPFRVRFIYGCALSALGKHDEAAKQFQYASILKPDEFAAWYDLGLEDQALQHYDDAVSAYRQAHQLNPDQVAPVSNMAVCMLKSNQASAAIDVLTGAVQAQPKSAQLHAALSDAYLQTNDLKDAVSELKTVVDLRPTDYLSRASLAELDMRNKSYADALAQYDVLLAAAPKSDAIMTQRGEALIDLKRYADAHKTLIDAVTINPKNARAWNNLGAADEYLGRIKDAMTDYKNGIAADPSLVEVRQNLARLINPPKPAPTIIMPPMTVKTGSGPLPIPTPSVTAPVPAVAKPAPTPAVTPTPAPATAPTPTSSAGTIKP